MPDYPLALSVAVQVLENGRYLGQALLFPEYSCFRASGGRLKSDVRWLAEKVLKELPAVSLHARHFPGRPERGEVRLTVEPERRGKAWLGPIDLKFDVVRWEHPPAEAFLAYVPALGIEIFAATLDEREQRIEPEIRAALLRMKALNSLRELVWLQRCRRFLLIEVPCSASRPGAKQAGIAAAEWRQPTRSVLRQVATDLTAEWLQPAYECDDAVGRLADVLCGHDPASALLIGPSGVGKTALVDELVRRRRVLGLGPRPVWRTSGARLVAGMSGFGMWEERCREVCREAAKTQAILHVGNLVELMEVGKSTASTIGIAGFLRSSIARRELVAIAECTPEQFSFIERAAPALLDAFHQIVLTEPDPATNRRIIDQTCAAFPRTIESGDATRRNKRKRKRAGLRIDEPAAPQPASARPAADAPAAATAAASSTAVAPLILPDALDTLDRLHRRYATYSAAPGRPVRFVRNLLRDAVIAQDAARAGAPQPDAPAPVSAADVTTAFSRETGLPLFLLDPAATFDLEAARGWFNARVLGQPEVADLIVDLLATAKTGLTRPHRPIASLLFIGPTGVGKTETSKSLAEFLFGSPDRLTRYDMSEFGDSLSVTRLIGGVFGSEGVLTGKVREQPFSVLLFDEVEKAGPEFFDLLLQILGDGRLTDAGGRLADFRNTVVIMTSNLGSESYQQGGVGFTRSGRSQHEAARHFENAVRNFVRPELFNRIDRIVPFAPLDEATILAIARLQLDQLLKRDGLKYRNAALTIDSEVARHVARRGFDPRYGARPLKRRIERELLAPLADRINGYAANLPLEARVEIAAGEVQLTVRPALDGGRQMTVGAPVAAGEAERAGQIVALRREHQRLEACPVVVELESELYRLSEWEKRLLADAAKKPGGKVWQRPEVAAALARLARLREFAAEIRDAGQAIVDCEQQALCRLYGEVAETSANPARELEVVRREWDGLLLNLYVHQISKTDVATVAVYSEEVEMLWLLAGAYLVAGRRFEYGVELHRLTAVKTSPRDLAIIRDKNTPPEVWRRRIDNPDEFLSAEQPGAIGLALTLRGFAALPRFEAEAGLHEFTDPIRPRLCLVDTAQGGIEDYQPPQGIRRRGAIAGAEPRRVYDRIAQAIVDAPLEARFEWFGRELGEVLWNAIERRLMREALRMLESNEAD